VAEVLGTLVSHACLTVLVGWNLARWFVLAELALAVVMAALVAASCYSAGGWPAMFLLGTVMAVVNGALIPGFGAFGIGLGILMRKWMGLPARGWLPRVLSLR
jgi:hypothetical protein